MALPITIPNTFANATSSIPLSQLDNNFSTVVVAINGIGNGAEALSNVNITGGTVANVNLSSSNANISGGNVTITTLSVSNGTNTAPSIRATSDTNTGVYFPAADSVALTANGIEGIRATSTGNVSIGYVNAPSAKLVVSVSNSASYVRGLNVTNDVNADFQVKIKSTETSIGPTTSNTPLVLNTEDTGRVWITSGGSVGVGVSSVGTNVKFRVNGNRSFFQANGEVYCVGVEYGPGGGATYIGSSNSATPDMIFSNSSGTEIMRVSNSGLRTNVYQTAFSAVNNGTPAISPASVIPINSEKFDVGNNFNTSTYTFTAPIAGKYLFSYSVRFDGYPANYYLHPGLQKNGTTISESQSINAIGSSVGDAYMSLTNTLVLDLAANDAIRLYDGSEGGTTGTYLGAQTHLTGYLLG